MDLILYYDMDNTMNHFPKNEAFIPERMYEEGYFLNLPPQEEINVLKQLIDLGYTVKILSAYILSEHCTREKKLWLKKHAPFIEEKDVILVPMGANKADYVEAKGNLLIDDYGKNLREWQTAGGIPVKYSNSDKNRDMLVIHNHKEIFDILADLENNIAI